MRSAPPRHRRAAAAPLVAFGLVAAMTGSGSAGPAPAARGIPGRIANAAQRGRRILSTLFFAGPPNPATVPLYTRHPRDADRLDWSDEADIDFALRQVAAAGLNTLDLSYWGHEGETDQWGPTWLFSTQRWPGAAGAPGRYSEAEQVALGRQFFRRAAANGLLAAPLLEVPPRCRPTDLTKDRSRRP